MLKRCIAIPAVDLLGGRVVRLRQGDYGRVTTFDVDPEQAAARYAEQGAEWLHVIDLDAARDGVRPGQHELILRGLAARSGLRLQLGGGVRTVRDIAAALELGVQRLVVGTLAARDPELVGWFAARSGRVAVAADVRGGTVRVAGWLEDTGLPPADFVSRLVVAGVRDFLVTAIDRDGTGAGPDTDLLRELRPLVPGALLAAGGIGGIDHLRQAARAGADGVVIGRALYDGSISYQDAVALCSSLSASPRSSATDSPS